jgi:hypothetical protein
MVNTVKPNANETPTNPIPKPGKPAAKTALPQPPNTNQNVPKNSAPTCFMLPPMIDMAYRKYLCDEFFAISF